MRGHYRYLAPFTPDSSGAMCVFADMDCVVIPNDLNGTVSTYRIRVGLPPDSPMKIESALGVRELSYVMGSQDAYLADYERILSQVSGAFVVLVHGPVSAVVGLDLRMLAHQLSERTGLAVLSVDCTGNNSYDQGISDALMAMLDHAQVQPFDGQRSGVNVLGVNRIDHGDADECAWHVEQLAAAAGKEVVSTWGCLGDWQRLKQASQAALNVVATASSLRLARAFEQRFGIAYVRADQLDMPWCPPDAATRIAQAARGKRILVVGEQLGANMVRKLIEGGQQSEDVVVGSFFAMDRACRRETDQAFDCEQAFARYVALKPPQVVVGDAALGPLLPEGTVLAPYAHSAISDENVWYGPDAPPAVFSDEWYAAVVAALDAAPLG